MNTILNHFDRLMMAITFAQANEPELAHECIDTRKRPQETLRLAARIMPNQIAH